MRSVGCHFQKPCYTHSEFRISLQSKALSQALLRCVIFFLRLCLGVISIFMEVAVWCSVLPLCIACDSPQLLWDFTSTLWLARFLPSIVPQLIISLHAFLLPGLWGNCFADYWPCKTNSLAVGQLTYVHSFALTVARSHKTRTSFSVTPHKLLTGCVGRILF